MQENVIAETLIIYVVPYWISMICLLMFIFLTSVIKYSEGVALVNLLVLQIKCNLNNWFMYVNIFADILAYQLFAILLFATRIYKEINKIKFRGILMECVWIHLVENGINYYILIVYTLA